MQSKKLLSRFFALQDTITVDKQGNLLFTYTKNDVLTLIEHWNGKKWKVVSSPSPGTGNNTLGSVIAMKDGELQRAAVWAGMLHE